MRRQGAQPLSESFFLALFKIMKAILSIFVILLVLLLIISTLGGSIRTNEQFVGETIANVKAAAQQSIPSNEPQQTMGPGPSPSMGGPSAMVSGPPGMPSAFSSVPAKPSFEQSSSGGTQNIYFIANAPKDMEITADKKKEEDSTEKTATEADPATEKPATEGFMNMAAIIEGYDNANFYAPA